MKKIRTFLKKLIVLIGWSIIWVVLGALLFIAGGNSHYLLYLVLWVLFSIVLLVLLLFWVFVAVKKWVSK